MFDSEVHIRIIHFIPHFTINFSTGKTKKYIFKVLSIYPHCRHFFYCSTMENGQVQREHFSKRAQKLHKRDKFPNLLSISIK